MSDPPRSDGEAPIHGDDSQFVRSPASAPGAATGSPGALFSGHSTIHDSSSHHQAQPADSGTGQKSGRSEDASDADGDHRDESLDSYNRFIALVARVSPPATEAVHECIRNRVVLEYEYHRGSDKHGTVLKDHEYTDKVNAFAECDKFFRGGVWRKEGEEGYTILTKEDEFRWVQVYNVCLHHVLQEQMCTELGYTTREVLMKYFAVTIAAFIIRVEPDDPASEPEISTIAYGRD
jgi:hypothetical protein